MLEAFDAVRVKEINELTHVSMLKVIDEATKRCTIPHHLHVFNG